MKGLESFGVTSEMVLQTDKETGPIDVAKHVAAERKASTIIRQTPKKSSQSNAHVERAHQTVEAMVRTMKEVIEDKAKIKLSATEDITAWMIRHAAFLQTRFSVGKDGKTAFKRGHHKDYASHLLPFGSAVDAKVRDEETERSKFDSRFIQGIWLGRATESDEHIVGTADGVYTARSVRAKNDQEIWNGDLIKKMRGTPWDPRAEDSRAEFRVPEERHRPPNRWNTNTRNLREFWDEMGKTAGCAGCVSPKGNKHNVACLSRQEEWKNKTIPQSGHMTHADDTEGQQITHETSSSSTVSNPNTAVTHNRDIDKQNSNDDSENPGEWTPAKRIRMKSKPMTQPKRPREMPTVLENMESCREWEQAASQTRDRVISQRS